MSTLTPHSHRRAPGRSSGRRFLARVFPPFFALAVAYVAAIRPWMLRWGATDAEIAGNLPGDDIVASPRGVVTRAISIHAPAEAVWPWLAQLGQGRGGLYSYDWLENLVGCDIHNADTVLPELQHVAIGDIIRLVPANYPVPLFFEVAEISPGESLVLRSHGDRQAALDKGLAFLTWAFVLRPDGADTTRLIVRWRADYAPTPSSAFWNGYGIEPIHFVMERKMLLGIKARAEALAAEQREPAPIPSV